VIVAGSSGGKGNTTGARFPGARRAFGRGDEGYSAPGPTAALWGMIRILQWVSVGAGLLMVAGTLLSLTRSPHWLVRGWDFPRMQITAVAILAGGAYALCGIGGGVLGAGGGWAFLAAVGACVLWQARKIYPYTPLARRWVRDSTRPRLARGEPGWERRATLRILISNVLQENTEHERLLALVRAADPDILLALETDEAWVRALEPLEAGYPHVVRKPLDNWYGLMLYSRLPLHDARVEFLIQDDIPSVHAWVELPSGTRVRLHGIHPRPPEPIHDMDSTPRDAELVLVGRTIGDFERDVPVVVAGDLNDVAWSPTTELFLRLSGLLDPRVGRGFYNSFNADNPVLRYPLDHVFHSGDFRLVELRRMPHIGSDHFPMLIELSYEPEAEREQAPLEERASDEEEAEEKLEEQAEAARTGDDRPSDG